MAEAGGEMSEDTKIVTAVRGGDVATQVISVECYSDTVYISEITFTPTTSYESANDGVCLETVISFEIGAIDAVIRELRKIQRAARSGNES